MTGKRALAALTVTVALGLTGCGNASSPVGSAPALVPRTAADHALKLGPAGQIDALRRDAALLHTQMSGLGETSDALAVAKVTVNIRELVGLQSSQSAVTLRPVADNAPAQSGPPTAGITGNATAPPPPRSIVTGDTATITQAFLERRQLVHATLNALTSQDANRPGTHDLRVLADELDSLAGKATTVGALAHQLIALTVPESVLATVGMTYAYAAVAQRDALNEVLIGLAPALESVHADALPAGCVPATARQLNTQLTDLFPQLVHAQDVIGALAVGPGDRPFGPQADVDLARTAGRVYSQFDQLRQATATLVSVCHTALR